MRYLVALVLLASSVFAADPWAPGQSVPPNTVLAGPAAAGPNAKPIARSLVLLDIGSSIWTGFNGYGLLAARPVAAAGNAGYLYFATDSGGGTLFRSNGVTWDSISSAGGGGTVTQINTDDVNITGGPITTTGTITLVPDIKVATITGTTTDLDIFGLSQIAGNATGGTVTISAGVGFGTGNGGELGLYGNSSGAGATGAGGNIIINAGSAMSTNGSGGGILIQAGDGTGSGNKGYVTIDTGTTGAAGAIQIGASNAGSLVIGRTGITTALNGQLAFQDDVRQTFNPGTNVAGFNVGAFAGDPGTPINGDLWYDSVANELTARINGTNVALGASSGGVSTATLPLIITGVDVALGTAVGPTTTDVNSSVTWSPSGTASKALVLQGKAAQTANLLEVQNSTGTVLTYFNSSGLFYTPRIEAIDDGLDINGLDAIAGDDGGGNTTITAGEGFGTGSGGYLTLRAGHSGAGATGSGGGVRIFSGQANSTDGYGGDIEIEAGYSNGTGDGALVSIIAGESGEGANTEGGALTLISGEAIGTGNSPGGLLSLTGGAGSDTGAGGAISIITGNSGTGLTGNGGALTLTSGDAQSTNGSGGAITITSGNGTGTGHAGAFNILGGVGGTGLHAQSGTINIIGGDAQGTGISHGGGIYLYAGVGSDVGFGGEAILAANDSGSGATGNGGLAGVYAGNAQSTNGSGGDLELYAGNATGAGVGGDVKIGAGGGGGVIAVESLITFPDDVRQTFNPGANAAGLNVGSHAGDPGTPSNGDLWYDSVANELTGRINGANVALGAGGGVADTYIKTAVRVATVMAGTFASSFENTDIVDGITLATNDRILIKNQATASTNGIYTVNASGAPTRATDMDSSAETIAGVTVSCLAGGANAGRTFMLRASTTPIVLATSDLYFTVINGGPNSGTSTFYGVHAGLLNSTGTNTAFGWSTMPGVSTGTFNTVMGFEAGRDLGTNLNGTTAFGYQAGAGAGGNNNTYFGANAGTAVTSAGGLVFVGRSAGAANTGSNNTYIGFESGDNITGGTENTAVGGLTMSESIASASYNAVLGYRAGLSLTSGNHNVFIGNAAGDGISSGARNVAIGYNANGGGAGFSADTDNVCIGYLAGGTMSGTINNVLIGTEAGTTGAAFSSATMVGYRAGRLNTASENTFIGNLSGTTNAAGTGQVFIGNTSGQLVTGNNNTLIGHNTASATLTTGTDNTAVGKGITFAGASVSGSIALGSGTAVEGSNLLVAGTSAFPIDDLYFSEGITNASPKGFVIRGTGTASGTSNTAGGDVIISGGRITGTGATPGTNARSGVRTQSILPGASSSTVEATAIDREWMRGIPLGLTDNSATTLVTMTIPALRAGGGRIEFTVEATDGTEVQVCNGVLRFNAYDKTGTIATPDLALTQSTLQSAGTLTVTFGSSITTTAMAIQITADTSLTTTTFRVFYTVYNESACVIALP